VPALLPERLFVDDRADDFLEAECDVLGAQEGLQFEEYVCAVGVEERGAGTVGGGGEEVEGRSERAVVGLGSERVGGCCVEGWGRVGGRAA
jgi:hypothetical protein